MTAPKPTVNTPLFLAGAFLPDVDGYLYEPTGQAAIIDGEHATIASTNAEADRWAKHEW